MRRLRAGTDHATANGPVVAATLGPLTPTTGKTRMRKAELAVYPRLVHRGSHRGPLRWRKSLPLLLVSGVVHDGQCHIHPSDDSKLANRSSTSLLCPADVSPPAAPRRPSGMQCLRPIRARASRSGARLRRPGACTAILSGAVCAGSNPAGGTGQRHKSEHSDNPGPTGRQACDLRKRGRVRHLAPDPPGQRAARRQTCCSAAFSDNGRQAVAVTADRCSSPSIRS
jgi:hypothetical protein